MPLHEIAVKLISGHGVASGKNGDIRYPEGTLRAQIPHFEKRGLDLSPYYPGTLNLDLAPKRYKIIKPKHYFFQLDWSEHIPPENFYFFDARLRWQEKEVEGMIYLPDPSTKLDHPQPPDMLEVLMPWIDELPEGKELQLMTDPRQLVFI